MTASAFGFWLLQSAWEWGATAGGHDTPCQCITSAIGFGCCSLLGSGVRLLEVMTPLHDLLEILNPRADSVLRASYEQQRRMSSTPYPGQA